MKSGENWLVFGASQGEFLSEIDVIFGRQDGFFSVREEKLEFAICESVVESEDDAFSSRYQRKKNYDKALASWILLP